MRWKKDWNESYSALIWIILCVHTIWYESYSALHPDIPYGPNYELGYWNERRIIGV